MANEVVYTLNSTASNMASEISGSGYFTGSTVIGDYTGAAGAAKAAFRFTGVSLNQAQSINSAVLRIGAQSKGGSGRLRFTAYGLDEDNTADFGSNPFGRTKTSATTARDIGISEIGSSFDVDVTGQVQEIINRGGWSSGNSIGLTAENNGSDTDNYINNPAYTSILAIRVSAEPNFFPTPGSVAAPTIPAMPTTGDVVFAISEPGYDVIEEIQNGDEAHLWFTSWKQKYKVFVQDTDTVVGGVTKQITHGLGYKPQVLVYARKNNYSLQFPRVFVSTDPVGSDVQGTYWVDTTKLYISSNITCDVYYYIFYDEQAT